MARSRYFQTPLFQDSRRGEPVHFATWNLPLSLRGDAIIDLLGDTEYAQYTWEFGDRLDRLANKYYNDDQYWWVIALVNNIAYPLGIKIGTVLRIPMTVDPILRKLDLI
jgi:hypothetical protein